MKASKCKCPHGHPWFVECFECASEVVVDRLGIGKVTIEHHDGYYLEKWTAYYNPKIYGRENFRPTEMVEVEVKPQ